MTVAIHLLRFITHTPVTDSSDEGTEPEAGAARDPQ